MEENRGQEEKSVLLNQLPEGGYFLLALKPIFSCFVLDILCDWFLRDLAMVSTPCYDSLPRLELRRLFLTRLCCHVGLDLLVARTQLPE